MNEDQDKEITHPKHVLILASIMEIDKINYELEHIISKITKSNNINKGESEVERDISSISLKEFLEDSDKIIRVKIEDAISKIKSLHTLLF